MAQLVLNNKVLTLIDETGSSAVDLSSIKGDDGARGPQGPAGVIVTTDGTIDMSGYATETWVTEQIEKIEEEADVDLSNYYTKAETGALVSANLDNYYTKDETDGLVGVDLSDYFTKSQTINVVIAGLDTTYSKSETDTKISNSLSNYYTKPETEAVVNEKMVDYYTKTEVNNKAITDLSNYYTKSETESLLTGTTVDLSNYYTKAETRALIPSVEGLATEEYVDKAIANTLAALDGSEVLY